MKNKLLLFAKFIVVAASLAYIALKIRNEINGLSIPFLDLFNNLQIQFLALCIILMPLNWLLEALKWKILIAPVAEIKVKNSLKAVMSGVTTSIFLPNRAGEFAGRILHLEKGKRSLGILPTFTGNISQLSITILAGLIGLMNIRTSVALSTWFDPLLLILTGTVVLILALYIYINPWLFAYISIYFNSKKIKNWLQTISTYSMFDLGIVGSLSAVRYMIFMVQYYATFHLFGIEIDFLNVFFGISVVFLALAFLPIISIGDVSIRGSLSILIIGSYGFGSAGILMASLLVWLINLAIPALAGGYFIWKTKLD